MLKVKKGVQPPLVYIIVAMANVSEMRGITLTITSGLDSRHGEWSGHYQLRCADGRSKTFPSPKKESIRDSLRSELRQYFPRNRVYCEIHDLGKRNEHYHLQFK